MNEETKTKEAGGVDEDQERAPTPEEKIAARVKTGISEEVERLENLAHRFLGEDRIKDHCQVIETLASIKARAEMYCIQLEMAMQTAAMASMLGSAMRQKQGDAPPQDIGDIADVLKRASRPGSKPGPDSQ